MSFPHLPIRSGPVLLALAAGAVFAAAGSVQGESAAPGTIWLIGSDTPATPRAFTVEVSRALAERGANVRTTTPEHWSKQADSPSGPGNIAIILPDTVLTADGRPAIERFLQQGNHLLSLSPSAFSSLKEPPILETLSPAYKTHSTRTAALRWSDRSISRTADAMVTIPLPRGRGLGSDHVRPARFIPLVEALDAAGAYQGAAAHLYLNLTTPYTGSVWGAVGLPATTLDNTRPDSVRLVTDLIDRLQRGLFLADAGPAHVAYAAGESVVCGADLVNLAREPRTVDVTLVITGDGGPAHEWSTRATVPPRTAGQPLHLTAPPVTLTTGRYGVSMRVLADGQPIDAIDCPLEVIPFDAVSRREVVGVDGGDFVLDGRPWHPLGMNYWPHLSVGREPGDFSLSWLSPEQYDPELVERDLALAEELRLNQLSIQYAEPTQARSLMDFLARAARHRLKVNLYCPAFEPLRPDIEKAQRLIREAHLRESPAVFAYDLCWEGHLGGAAARHASDPRWQTWVVERYGSIAAAEEDWRFRPPQIAGVISGPTDEQLTTDGGWRVFVAAYRRFWDDEISHGYRNVRDAIHAVDPVHLIGARSGYGGNGTPMYAHLMPFDLASGARYLDFISPEGYALAGDWPAFLKGGLTAAYARLVSGGKPVFWAEYGVPLRWQVEAADYRPAVTAAEFEPQRAYFETMLRFVRETGAAGSSGWWWPGGYRVDEKSDFGIINPDRSLRPAARELQRAARANAEPRARFAPDVMLEMDRDQHVSGYAGIHTTLADRYVKLILDGHTPGLDTVGTGTTSANTPPVAVGNVPWTGRNPPKYLNAEFTRVEVLVGDRWHSVENGETVALTGGLVHCRVSVANTAEARWLPPAADLPSGGVYLAVADGRSLARLLPLPHAVAYLEGATFAEFEIDAAPGQPVDVVLRLRAEKRTAFGEVFRLRLGR
ncbi:MAG: hypothetical protein HYV95_05200 [Opitutae bacterium]|nr:hypothetical protein [Opitutae bacterium]